MDLLKFANILNKFASYNPESSYYDYEPGLTIMDIIDRWQTQRPGTTKHGRPLPRQKMLDDSMPIMVPTDIIWPYREYTWSRDFARQTPEEWDALYEILSRYGWDPNKPLLFNIGREGGAKIGEGNHRLAIARELGIAEVPVRFIFESGPVTKTEVIRSPEGRPTIASSLNRLLKFAAIFESLAYEADRASGFLFLSPADKTMFLVQRSKLGDMAGTWASAGGKVEKGESFLQAAEREIEEELGSMPKCKTIKHSDFHDGDFTYRTYIANLTPEQKKDWKPRINEEATDSGWFKFDQLPKKLHPGFKTTLDKLKEDRII